MQKLRLWEFLWLCIKKAWDSTWEKADVFTTAFLIVIGVILHFVPKWEAAVNSLYWEIPVVALASLSLYRLLMSPFWLYRDKDREVRKLQQQLTRPGELAEEDPRVFLQPLNAEFVSQGFMVFEMWNGGQRPNPAQGITVQTIPCIPTVRFEYIDRLEANERKRVVPTVGDDILPSHNILPSLDKAWKALWEDGESDPERVDLEFQINVTYRDFRPRHFETTVTLKYFPLEMQELSRNVVTGRYREYLKVTNTDFKRLS